MTYKKYVSFHIWGLSRFMLLVLINSCLFVVRDIFFSTSNWGRGVYTNIFIFMGEVEKAQPTKLYPTGHI